jgi:hypothetical protein
MDESDSLFLSQLSERLPREWEDWRIRRVEISPVGAFMIWHDEGMVIRYIGMLSADEREHARLAEETKEYLVNRSKLLQ